MAVLFNNSFGVAVSIGTSGVSSTNVGLSVENKSNEAGFFDDITFGLLDVGGGGEAKAPFNDKAFSGASAFGFATEFSGGFEEAITEDGVTLTGSPDVKYGEFVLRGVAFAKTCGDAGFAGRHGIEGLLDFWKEHRASETGLNVKVVAKIGRTVLKGAITSIYFQPLDSNFNILQWAIGMLVEPKYTSYPLSDNTGGGGF